MYPRRPRRGTSVSTGVCPRSRRSAPLPRRPNGIAPMENVCAGGGLCGLCGPQDPPMDEILLRIEISRHTPMCAEKWPNHAAHRGAGRRLGRRSGGRLGAAVGGDGGRGDGRGDGGRGGTCGRGRRPRRPAPGAGAAATSAALPCGVRGISLRNGRGGRVATYRRAKAPRQGSAGPSSAGLRFVRWSSVRPLAFGRRARTRSKRGCHPRRTARPCRSRSRRPSP